MKHFILSAILPCCAVASDAVCPADSRSTSEGCEGVNLLQKATIVQKWNWDEFGNSEPTSSQEIDKIQHTDLSCDDDDGEEEDKGEGEDEDDDEGDDGGGCGDDGNNSPGRLLWGLHLVTNELLMGVALVFVGVSEATRMMGGILDVARLQPRSILLQLFLMGIRAEGI